MPSFSPPRIIRSARWSRASIKPQIASLGWTPYSGRTVTPAISAESTAG